MWVNYFKTAVRSLSRNKTFSIINVLGLSVGIASFILIMMFVSYHFSFDKHFKNAEQIYRVTLDMRWSNAPKQAAAVAPAPTAYHLAKEYPEIIAGTRFAFLDRKMFEYVPDSNNKQIRKFYEEDICAADSGFFKVFDLEIIRGDKLSLLSKANSLIISESLAKKHFPDIDPIGQVITMDGEQDLVINGIMKDIPGNTHFNTNMIISTLGVPIFDVNNWRPLDLYAYVLFSKNADPKQFEPKLLDFKNKFYEPWKDESDFRLQKMLDIHLKNDRIFDFAVTTSLSNLYFLTIIAFLILIVACINFMNLSTARSVYRSKEVGIRKVVGASRRMLIAQFLGESLIVATVSMFVAVVIVESFMPEFRNLSGLNISFSYIEKVPFLILLTLIVGFLSGIYPAFFTSSFKPVSILKGSKTNIRGGGLLMRKIMVIFQFVVMVILLCGLIILIQQMRFVKNKDMGFDKDFVFYTGIQNDSDGKISALLKQKLMSKPGIESVCVSNFVLGSFTSGDHFIIEGSEEFNPMRTVNIGCDYIPTYKMKMLAGRNFSRDFGTDSIACIINQAAVRKFGWTAEGAIGKKISWNFSQSWDNQIFGHVVGVVEDFNFKSLHEEIEPVVLTMNHVNNVVSARLRSENLAETLAIIEDAYSTINPNFPLDYGFLEKSLAENYIEEELFTKIFTYFVLLTVLIACLGLIGLTAFIAERKFKEIGIRRTLGASTKQIVLLFSREFALWVAIANVLGWPLAWLAMNAWLERFTYSIDISPLLFVFVGLATEIIALTTVGLLAYKAATKKPVDAIRYE
jgi:putative ABC transport system permease protein